MVAMLGKGDERSKDSANKNGYRDMYKNGTRGSSRKSGLDSQEGRKSAFNSKAEIIIS